jgi:hypothetical protein
MKSQSPIRKILILIILLFGVLLGIALVGIATWGDMETVLFYPASTADKDLSNLQCPIVISKTETGLVSVNIKNSSTYTVTPIIRFTVSQGSTIFTEGFTNQPSIPPNSTQKIFWQVTSNEAAYHESLILVQVFVNRSYPLPSRSNTCGITVMNLGPLTGKTVVIGSLCLSLATMLLGSSLWIRSHKTIPGHRDTLSGGLIALELIIFIGILASLFALWMVGLISFLLSVLMIVVLIARFGVEFWGAGMDFWG